MNIPRINISLFAEERKEILDSKVIIYLTQLGFILKYFLFFSNIIDNNVSGTWEKYSEEFLFSEPT